VGIGKYGAKAGKTGNGSGREGARWASLQEQVEGKETNSRSCGPGRGARREWLTEARTSVRDSLR
jgi:hypothetical protein